MSTNKIGTDLKNATVQLWLGRGYLAGGNVRGKKDNHAEVTTITQQLLRFQKDMSEAYILRGIGFFVTGDLEKGQIAIKEGLRKNPDDTDAMFLFKKVIKPVCSNLEKGKEFEKDINDTNAVLAQHKESLRQGVECYDEVVSMLEGETSVLKQKLLNTTAETKLNSFEMDKQSQVHSLILGLSRSNLLANTYGDRSSGKLRLRNYEDCLQDGNASIRVFASNRHKNLSEKFGMAVTNRSTAFLKQKKYKVSTL